jgi:hypothetical protein
MWLFRAVHPRMIAAWLSPQLQQQRKYPTSKTQKPGLGGELVVEIRNAPQEHHQELLM